MLQHIISNSVATAKTTDTVGVALQLMDDDDLKNIVVFNDDIFIGMLSKETLLNYDESETLSNTLDDLLSVFVLENEHFSRALKIMADKQLDVLPVLNSSKKFVGVVLATDLLFKMAQFVGADEKGAIIMLDIDRRDFAFSELTRLIETNDATIMHLNTQLNTETGLMLVTIKINKQEVSDVIATLQRFEYNVVAYFGEEAFENQLQENYNHLLHYLNI